MNIIIATNKHDLGFIETTCNDDKMKQQNVTNTKDETIQILHSFAV